MREMPSAERMYLERNDAYAQRDELVNLVAKMANALGWLTWLGLDMEAEDGWKNVVYICLPSGQVSWHITDAETTGMFSWLPKEAPVPWDGHDTETKRERVRTAAVVPVITAEKARAWANGWNEAVDAACIHLVELQHGQVGHTYEIAFSARKNPHSSASGLRYAGEPQLKLRP